GSTQRETAAGFERAAASPARASALGESLIHCDVTHLLPHIAAPTLVVHRRHEIVDVEQGRYLAAHIPGAEYLELEGVDHLPWIGDADAVLAAVERFLAQFGGR